MVTHVAGKKGVVNISRTEWCKVTDLHSGVKATYLAEISVDHDGTAIGPGSTLDYV